MKKSVTGIFIAIILIAGVYLFFFTNIFKSCSGCDDFNKCTEDLCSEETDFNCVHKPIENCCGNSKCETGEDYETCADDCENCDDLNSCTTDSYDYHLQKCVNSIITPCCGNGKCESTESQATCSQDCIFADDEYIELGTSYLNNPSHFADTGQKYFYSIENCLSDQIETLEIKSYYDNIEVKSITKSWLEGMGTGTSEYNFINIPTSTCNNRITLIQSTQDNRELGTTHNVKIYYKFKYKGRTFEATTSEKEVTVLDREPMKGVEQFAIFTIDNSNIGVLQ